MYIYGMRLLVMLMTLRCDDVDVDDVTEMNACCVLTLSEYLMRGKGIGLKIISVLGEGRGIFKNFNHPR